MLKELYIYILVFIILNAVVFALHFKLTKNLLFSKLF